MAAFGQPAPPPAAPATPPPAAPAPDPAAGATPPPAAAPAAAAPPAAPAADAAPAAPADLGAAIAPIAQAIGVPAESFQALLTPDENGGTALAGLVSLYEMFTDENKVDDLATWWDAVGEEFNFFDDDEPNGRQTAAAADAPAGEIDLSNVDPAIAQVIQGLQAKVEQLEGNFTQQTQQQQVAAAGEKIAKDLADGMKAAGIPNFEKIDSEESTDILRMAVSYGEDPEAMTKAITRYAQITGARAPQAEPAIDTSLGGVAALQAALGGGSPPQAAPASHGPALGRGNADTEPEPVHSWNDARALALQRLQQQG